MCSRHSNISLLVIQNGAQAAILCAEPGNAVNIATVEAAGIPHVVNAEANGELHSRHPYVYSSAEDLRLADVELLLSAYKQLVRRDILQHSLTRNVQKTFCSSLDG